MVSLGLEPRQQDGRCRGINLAMAAPPTYILLTYILIIFISYDSFKSSDLQQTTTKKKTIDAPPKGSTKVSRKVKKPKHKQTIKTPVEPAQRKVRKDKVAGPPFVCAACWRIRRSGRSRSTSLSIIIIDLQSEGGETMI